MDRKLNIIILAVLMACLRGNGQTLAPVKILSVETGPIEQTVQGYGTIEPLPEKNIAVTADSPMRILDILVKPGEQVSKGQMVVKLQRDHSLDVAVSKAHISLQKDSIDYHRAITLYDSGVIPKVKLENARNSYQLSKADYELQRKQLDYALQNSELRSPIQGVVTSVSGAVGQIADPANPILRIVNLYRMIAIIGIEIEDIGKIREGQPARITIPNLPDSPPFHGIVSKLNREIDPATQLINIWVEINNPDSLLQPGMFAEARIVVDQAKHALVVPRTAVLKDSAGPYLYIVSDSIAQKIQVRTGIENDSLVQILHGLKKGEQVVYQGNYELEDSMKVRIIRQ